MSLTSVFGMGSDESAAGGGVSDLSEWPRSAENKSASPDAVFAGHRNRKQVEHLFPFIRKTSLPE